MPYDNAFKAQWELFLRHLVRDEPFQWNLLEGARGVQLAEKGLESWSAAAGSTSRARSITLSTQWRGRRRQAPGEAAALTGSSDP
jgi:hypothetical protein